jgi:hypothetical protein
MDQVSVAREHPEDGVLQGLLREARERDGMMQGPSPPKKIPLKTYTAKELAEMDLTPPEFIIDGLLPCGVAILAAPSKIGKSWLALDMALSVVYGNPFMGYRTNCCEALYLALEDSLYRLNDRIGKLLAGEPNPCGLHTSIESETMSQGFTGQLEDFLSEHPAVKFVIVDTFQKVRPQAGKNQTAYEADYQTLNKFKALSAGHNACILLIHHTRKSNGLDTDPFENILGSTALQGATDTMFVIKKKKRTDETAVFSFTGRDIFQQELYIHFDKPECKWKNQGTVEEIDEQAVANCYESDPLVRTIVESVNKTDKWRVSLTELHDEVARRTGSILPEYGKALSTRLQRLAPLLEYRDSITYEKDKSPVKHNGRSVRLYSFQQILPENAVPW